MKIPVRAELLTMEECRHLIASMLGGMAQSWGINMVRVAIAYATDLQVDGTPDFKWAEKDFLACASILGAMLAGLSSMATAADIQAACASLVANGGFWVTVDATVAAVKRQQSDGRSS